MPVRDVLALTRLREWTSVPIPGPVPIHSVSMYIFDSDCSLKPEKMKRKILYMGLFSIILFTACEDFLEVKTESRFDSDFIFQSEFEADKAILGAYQLLDAVTGIHSNRLFYDAIAVGSDIEVGPENPSFGYRYTPGNYYNQTPQLSDLDEISWNGMYTTINRCNIIIDALESSEAFINADKTTPSAFTHIFGEAVAIRATLYFELTRCFGDVIYSAKPITTKADYADVVLTNRNDIQETEINHLIEIEPMMYRLNSGSADRTAERMSKEYVQGLIGRLALVRGGFALRPAEYTGDGEIIQSHPVWGKMVRRTDWKIYYELAKTYLEKLVNEGNTVLTTMDPRTPVEKYGNPFQFIFQQGMDYKISEEMIFEISQKPGNLVERPYAFGRPSDGGSTGFPPKAYGQIRFFPTYYYNMFHPRDLRRDVTVAVTALGGVADEIMLCLKKGNKSRGGLALNKWDYSRMADKTYAIRQRRAGINAPYMRLGDMILLLAETYAVLGEEAKAKAELLKIRSRAFSPDDPEYNILVTDYVNGLSGDALIEAIQDERAFELGGEGQRRFDLVRWGILGRKIYELQTGMDEISDALATNGYYEFDNGNTITTYIYTKQMTKEQSGLEDLLTTTCNVDPGDPLYPLLYPGWRGTFTDWESGSTTLLKLSLAIRGLFERISPVDSAALIADGYVATPWGVDLIDEAWRSGVMGIYGGYLPSDYLAGYPPRYIQVIPASTIVASQGKVTNKYGFPNE